MAEGFEPPYLIVPLQQSTARSSFCVKSRHYVDLNIYNELPRVFHSVTSEMQRPGGMYQQEDLKIKKIVIFFCQALNGYVRGIIQHITEDGKCNVYAIDYDVVEKNVGVERIFHPVHDRALHTPGLARHFEWDIPVKNAPDHPEPFRYFVGNENLYLQIRGRNEESMRIIIFKSKPEDIAALLSMTCFAEPIPSVEPSQLTFDWKHHKLEAGETLNVRVQCFFTMSRFFACTQRDYRDYLKSRDEFTRYCRSQPQIPYNEFVRGKPIGVKEHNEETYYERAIIVEVVNVGYRARVKLIDWGKEFITNIEKVKLIRSEKFFVTPARALYCSAPNSNDWNALPRYLHEGFALAITVTRVGAELDIPHLVSLSPPLNF